MGITQEFLKNLSRKLIGLVYADVKYADFISNVTMMFVGDVTIEAKNVNSYGYDDYVPPVNSYENSAVGWNRG